MSWIKGVMLFFFGGGGMVTSVGMLGFLSLFPYDAPAEPPGIQRGTIRVGELDRTYLYYAPERLAERPALVFAFHGSKGTGQKMREWTGYRLERLADRYGFVVVYPDGYENHWNDCRARGPYSANVLNIDDPGFVHALTARFRRDFGAGEFGVLALGYSNGGHMAFRLALERPDEVAGVAAIGANLPAPAELDCAPAGKPVPVLVMNGTEDPINPYDGGIVTIFGFGNRGEVLSTRETAGYFVKLAGHPGSPTATRLPERDGDPDTWVERLTWSTWRLPEVAMYTIHGAGHTIPQSEARLPRLLGPTSTEIDGLEEIWQFFARQIRARESVALGGSIEPAVVESAAR